MIEVILGQPKNGLIMGSTIVLNGVKYIGVTHQCPECKTLFNSTMAVTVCPDDCGFVKMRQFGEKIL